MLIITKSCFNLTEIKTISPDMSVVKRLVWNLVRRTRDAWNHIELALIFIMLVMLMIRITVTLKKKERHRTQKGFVHSKEPKKVSNSFHFSEPF